MALDPQVKTILERMTASQLPPLHTLGAPQARMMFDTTALVLDAKNVPIGATEDRKVPGAGGEIPIRVYTPVNAPAGPLPALVFFHGGGFVIGSIKTHDAPCRLVANAAGCKVVSVEYRLAPEHKFPAAVEDCFAAANWVAENGASIGVDSKRLAVGGDSAGGNLTAVVCQLAKAAGNKPNIAFQLLIYPTTDAVNQTASRRDCSKGYFLETELMTWFYDHYVNSGTDRHDLRISPLLAPDLSGLPPAYVITAGFDPLRDEGAAYAAKLKAAGVPTTHVNYEGMIHGFWNMSGVIDKAKDAINDASAALKKALA